MWGRTRAEGFLTDIRDVGDSEPPPLDSLPMVFGAWLGFKSQPRDLELAASPLQAIPPTRPPCPLRSQPSSSEPSPFSLPSVGHSASVSLSVKWERQEHLPHFGGFWKEEVR